MIWNERKDSHTTRKEAHAESLRILIDDGVRRHEKLNNNRSGRCMSYFALCIQITLLFGSNHTCIPFSKICIIPHICVLCIWPMMEKMWNIQHINASQWEHFTWSQIEIHLKFLLLNYEMSNSFLYQSQLNWLIIEIKMFAKLLYYSIELSIYGF